MDKNHYVLMSLIERCDSFIASVPHNQLLDTSIKQGKLTRLEVLYLLAGSEIIWDECMLGEKCKAIEFRRFNGRNYEYWVITMDPI